RRGPPPGTPHGTGHTVLASYDAAGRLISVTDPTGNTTEFEWDALDRSVGRVDALGGRTTWKYDPDGNLVSVTDPLGNTTTYTYSDLQWLATKTDPLGRNETYDYDPMGLLRTLTDPSGQVTSFTYDPVYRLTRVHFGGSAADPTASSTIDYTWDSDDELLSATDSVSGRISRTYDRLGQLVSETTPQGSIAYTYDAAGRRSSMTVDGTSATAYGWDDAGRLTEIARGPVTVDFAYDAAGRIETIAQPNDVTTGYAYDPASQVTAIAYRGASGTIGDLAYARAPDGRIVNRSGSLAGTLLPDAMTAATYDPAGQLTRWGDHSMRYDPNGNLLTDGTRTLTWDSRGQLTGIAGATAASFAYDAFGRRVASTVSGATATYRYDGLNAVSRQVGNGPTTGYVSGLGLDTVFASSDGTTGIAFMRDHLGSTIGLVGPGSSLDAKYTYEPYGRSETNHDDGRNTIRFTGREDDGTGLLYYRARHMDPVTGRFLSPDPITFDGFGLRPRSRVGTLLAEVAGIGPIATALGPERGLPGAVAQQGSAYAYVGSDPLSGRDPTGAIFPLIAVVVVAGWTAWRGHVEASCGSTALGRHCPPSGGGGGGGPGPGGGGGPGPGGGGGGPGSGGDTGPGAGYGPVGDLVGGLLHGFGFGGDDPSGGQDPGVTVHT
ncbi:MAG: hypothetical protein LH650_08575, partial [Chloroflexi bacterium]|nr:hypothetical protein [Chloroflexota bacterium]